MKNINLNKAKEAKNDEFYTQYDDIHNELQHYTKHFEDKIIFCNCDDPEWSNFWKYFKDNFHNFKLKKLISTHYKKGSTSYKLEYDGINIIKTELIGDGDFRSEECVEILKEVDIVASNPPFSLFRAYVAQLIEYDKKFVIIGSQNAITYKEIFPLLKNDKIWLGYNHVKEFTKPDGSIQKFGNICWYTNIDIDKRHEFLELTKNYNPKVYPKYDNYDAINVDKVIDIPCDYLECIGVPITFLEKYNPEQFEVVGLDRYVKDNPHYGRRFTINEKEIYARILIRKKDVKDKPIEAAIKILKEEYGYTDEEINYCNGVIGVPITFLEKYNPDQFEILGITSGRNEFNKEAWPTKRYKHAVQHNKDGTIANGSKANTRATIPVENKPNNTYYTADNIDNYLQIVYARILIKLKHTEPKTEPRIMRINNINKA